MRIYTVFVSAQNGTESAQWRNKQYRQAFTCPVYLITAINGK